MLQTRRDMLLAVHHPMDRLHYVGRSTGFWQVSVCACMDQPRGMRLIVVQAEEQDRNFGLGLMDFVKDIETGSLTQPRPQNDQFNWLGLKGLHCLLSRLRLRR